jgi:hypothetical protein
MAMLQEDIFLHVLNIHLREARFMVSAEQPHSYGGYDPHIFISAFRKSIKGKPVGYRISHEC